MKPSPHPFHPSLSAFRNHTALVTGWASLSLCTRLQSLGVPQFPFYLYGAGLILTVRGENWQIHRDQTPCAMAGICVTKLSKVFLAQPDSAVSTPCPPRGAQTRNPSRSVLALGARSELICMPCPARTVPWERGAFPAVDMLHRIMHSCKHTVTHTHTHTHAHAWRPRTDEGGEGEGILARGSRSRSVGCDFIVHSHSQSCFPIALSSSHKVCVCLSAYFATLRRPFAVRTRPRPAALLLRTLRHFRPAYPVA